VKEERECNDNIKVNWRRKGQRGREFSNFKVEDVTANPIALQKEKNS